MNIFRRLIKSKFGGIFAIAFIGIIGFAFIAGDLGQQAGSGVLGSSSGEVARIGKQRLTIEEVQARAQQVFEQIRQNQPEYTMDRFLAEGGLEEVVNGMISSRAIAAYGAKQGFSVSKALIDAEIARIPAFADASGKFSENQFRTLLAQQRVQEKDLRADIANQIMLQQLVRPVSVGAFVPEAMVGPYARMLLEQRTGQAIAVPSIRFAPKDPAPDNVLQAFYKGNQGQFSVPERRKLRYMLVDRSRFEQTAQPTDAEIAEAYKARAAQYAARDSRSFTQLIVQTEAVAKDIAAKVAKGATLSAAATSSGLSASTLPDLDKASLASQSSEAVANAAFSAASGALVGPLKAPLGWTLLHVDTVRSVPARTLADARGELVEELKKTKVAQAFSDFLSQIDGQVGEGATFAEIAKARGLQIVETPAMTSQGVRLGDALYKPDETVTAILKSGFSMASDDDPQIVAVKPDEQAAIVAVAEVIPAGPVPFADAKAAVQIAWSLSEGLKKAKAAADALAKALSSGQPVAAAITANGLTGSPTQPLDARRGDISQGGNQVPPPLVALFAMKQGNAKAMPLDQSRGFLVVQLDKIVPGEAAAAAPLIAPTRNGLKEVLANDYGEQMSNAARQDVGVTRNASAIATIAKALREANGSAQ